EVDAEPVDRGRELRERVQLLLTRAPVVFGRPVAREVLYRRELHTLRPVGDELPRRPARRRDTAPQVVDLLLWNLDVERANLGGSVVRAHNASLLAATR